MMTFCKIAFALLLVSGFAVGRALEEGDFIANSRIGIFPGTFDPITNSHVKIAERMLDSGQVDFVLFLPTHSPIHKKTLSVEERINMIDAALEKHPRLLYPKSPELLDLYKNSKRFQTNALIRHIQRMNPEAYFVVGVGQDVFEKPHAVKYIQILYSPKKWAYMPITERKKPAPRWLSAMGIDRDAILTMERNFESDRSTTVRKSVYENKGAQILVQDGVIDRNVARIIEDKGYYLKSFNNTRSPFSMGKEMFMQFFGLSAEIGSFSECAKVFSGDFN